MIGRRRGEERGERDRMRSDQDRERRRRE